MARSWNVPLYSSHNRRFFFYMFSSVDMLYI